jgi:hypothetical protein
MDIACAILVAVTDIFVAARIAFDAKAEQSRERREQHLLCRSKLRSAENVLKLGVFLEQVDQRDGRGPP